MYHQSGLYGANSLKVAVFQNSIFYACLIIGFAYVWDGDGVVFLQVLGISNDEIEGWNVLYSDEVC
jgi:hypothetical protein